MYASVYGPIDDNALKIKAALIQYCEIDFPAIRFISRHTTIAKAYDTKRERVEKIIEIKAYPSKGKLKSIPYAVNKLANNK